MIVGGLVVWEFVVVRGVIVVVVDIGGGKVNEVSIWLNVELGNCGITGELEG